MDFVKKLPSSSSSNTIFVIVDWLLKQAIFILTYNTITLAKLVYFFIIHIFSKHGVFSHITSDQGSKFVFYFFCSLGVILDIHYYTANKFCMKSNI